MKVQVKDLKPNPFRKIKKYPINKEKVKSLKTSISETSFWDNLLARKRNGNIEIAYGHHRLIAVQELGIETIDIPVRDLDDGQMIRIMANENLDDWKMTPSVYTETVLVAKEYLDGELAKYETWDKCLNKNIKALFSGTKGDFQHAKTKGVGQTTILKFLGGNWKQWVIQDALSTITSVEEKEIDREAINELPSAVHSRKFKAEVKKYKIPKEEQKGLAKQITKKNLGVREVSGHIEQHAKITGRIKKTPPEPKKRPQINEFVSETIAQIDELTTGLFKLVGNVKYIDSEFIKQSLKTNLDVLSEMIEKIKKEF